MERSSRETGSGCEKLVQPGDIEDEAGNSLAGELTGFRRKLDEAAWPGDSRRGGSATCFSWFMLSRFSLFHPGHTFSKIYYNVPRIRADGSTRLE